MSVDSCQNKKTHWPVSHDHIVGPDVVSVSCKMEPRVKNYTGQLGVNSCMQVTSSQFDMGGPFHGQFRAVKTRYPLTSNPRQHRGPKCRTH